MKINFSRIFEGFANAYGDREAIVNIERNRRYNYREYHALTNRIMNMMHQTLGIERGEHYVLVLNNDNLSFFTIPAVMKGRGVACYTNYRDPVEQHAQQLDIVKPKVVFIEADLINSHFDMLREMEATIVCMDPVTGDDPKYSDIHYFWDMLEGITDENPDIEHDDREDTVLIRFTGGTTGKGKCAEYTVDNLMFCRESFLTIPEPVWHKDVRLLHMAPISHGSGAAILATLSCGGCTITMNAPDLTAYCAHVEAERATGSFMVPTILYGLLESPEAAAKDLSSLETIIYGAAPMSPTKLKQLQERFGNIFLQMYGATEFPGIALVLPKYAHLIQSKADEKRLASAGKPAPGIEILIANENGDPVQQGEVGEIWLRSRGIIKGYYKDPEKTAEEFVDGYWKSGDMAQMDEAGFITIVDRMKDMIISGGFNIYSTEVEAAINTHPAVFMSAVVGIPHEKWGEAVHAEVVLKPGQSVTDETLAALVAKEIGSYKAPKSIKFVEQLPMSGVGKILRREVRDKYWKNTDRNVG